MTKEQGTLFDGLGPAMPAKLRGHPLYGVWSSMRKRCDNPNYSQFKDYGGRGIFVCDEWRASSRAFIAWALSHGWQPGLQLDRRDNEGPYSPGNCRFVTRSVNRLNCRATVRLFNGRAALPVAEANGVPRPAFYYRVRNGWTPDQAAGVLPPPASWFRLQRVQLLDGRLARSVARANGIADGTFKARLRRGWTPDQAAGIAPPPQRRQKAAGQAQPVADGRRRRKTDKPASQPAPGRCGATKQKRGMQDA